ncbi:MAG: SHOCT domain-containing protein [Gemmatimonadota bacterium]
MGMWGWGMGVFWLVILVLLGVFGWRLMSRGGGTSSTSAEETLRQRYARGEIDEETFRRMMDELRSG